MTAEAATGPTVRTITVVFTDLVGSTELFSRLGEERAERLRAHHFDLLGRAIAFHGGRQVKNLGDGLMAAFESASDGLRAAAAMQRDVHEDNRRRGRDPIGVRVGVSLGEATVDDGDCFGPPVVEASRLCALADAGEILATETARLLAGSRADLAFESAGALNLKGLPVPIAAVRVRWEPVRQQEVRVVLADDAVLLREGLARLLEESGIAVIAQAGDRDELLRCVVAHRPDLAITDVRMPPTRTLEGLEVAEIIRERHPGIGVLLLSQHLETRYAIRLLARGVHGVGYLLKERVTEVDEFARAARRVAAGGTAIDPDVVAALLARRRMNGAIDGLEAAQVALLCELAQGHSAEEIVTSTGGVGGAVAPLIDALFCALDLPVPEPDDRVEAALGFLARVAVGKEQAA